jgi:tetratricopeptide (TPR) repeat protein
MKFWPRRFKFLLIILIPGFCSGQKVFDFNTACRNAYKEIIQLKLDNGQRMLDIEKSKNPNNLIPYFLENYIDFFTLFFNEDPAEYKKRIGNREKRLDLIDDGPGNSPFYLYTKAVIHFQWASIRIKFSYNWDAGWEFRRSFLQMKDNLESFPAFSPNLMYNGAMQVAAGTIPDGYKWLSNLLGIKGSIKNGMMRLEKFLNATDEWALLFREEAIFYYCYLKFYIQNDKDGVFNFIQSQKLDVVNNHLFAYLAANLGINNQSAELAKGIITSRNMANGYFVTPVWDMELGYAKMFHLEPDAVVYLERFVNNFKGKFYVKDALQKLSWYYHLQGDHEKALVYRKKILEKGSTDTEADKQAQKEAGTSTWPNPLLLRARLLNDGGYHREALRLLHGKNINEFALPEEKLEFAYRAGRIYDDLAADEQAIIYYRNAIALGEKRKEYFAARAALQIGFIYEKKGDKTAALTWFRRCMSMKDHDFKNSLDQRAKAGIARCEN